MSLDPINYLAIELLEKLGNSTPTEEQIELISLLLSTYVLQRGLAALTGFV